jgi:hypothetical protein
MGDINLAIKQSKEIMEAEMKAETGYSDIKAIREIYQLRHQIKELQTEVITLEKQNTKDNIKAEKDKNVAYGISIFLVIIILGLVMKKIKVFTKVRYFKNSKETSDEFIKKKTVLEGLLKSEAIDAKEYKQKMDLLMNDTSVKVKQAKLLEALNAKVISEEEYKSKLEKL